MSWTRRFIPLIVAIALVVGVSPAEAGRQWCHRDPVFLIGGAYVSVDVAVYDTMQGKVTKPIDVVLSVPPGVSASLVSTDSGFNGLGETVSINTNKQLKATKTVIQVRVTVTVTSTQTTPLLITIVSKSGRSTQMTTRTNQSVTLNSSVAPGK